VVVEGGRALPRRLTGGDARNDCRFAGPVVDRGGASGDGGADGSFLCPAVPVTRDPLQNLPPDWTLKFVFTYSPDT
jgi:hypothetical protein